MRRRGLRASFAGTRQRFECLPGDSERHFFTVAVSEPGEPNAPVSVRCPDPRHADARIHARGSRETKAGTWRRYRCLRPDGSRHDFQVLATPAGTQLTSLHRPPPCPEHAVSKVVRHGTYGRGPTKRQRYRCVPADGTAAPHTFTPPLTREVVAVGTDACVTCDELLSPHRGTLTGARHTPWSLALNARALNELAMGASYAAVSLMMRDYRDRADQHLHEHHGELLLDGQATGSAQSYTAAQGKGAWHLAADLVEQYAPLLWRGVEQQLQEREHGQRATNDAQLAANPQAALAAPITWLLDEQPVYISARRRGPERRLERTQWSLLVVVEVRWHPADDPMSYPRREYRLRLARAYPRPNEQAWRLVLDELGVRPDFIIADNAGAISNAVASHYGEGSVGLVPSLFHIQRNLRAALRQLPGATTSLEGRRVLVPELAKHLDVLSRDELLNLGPTDWATWWDNLVAAVAALPAPVAGLLEQRRLYEPKVAAALPILTRQPQLPASNAAVENRIRHALEPFLDNRKQMYRNLARTNFLLDLAVARAQGAFTDLDKVARLLREDNEAAGGWAPAPRTLADAQPPPRAQGERPPVYSSLLNPLLVAALAEDRLGTSPADGGSS
ncbi:MAG: hypothetical protein ACXV2H_06850 [Actinomycetes bacterium]